MLSRRALITQATSAAALATLVPGRAGAETPKRGGTLAIRLWDPPHWDPYLTLAFRTHYSSSFMDDAIALILKDLKAVGIDTRLNQKEYGAYISTSATGNYEAMYYGATPFLDPDNYLFTNYAPGHPRNVAKVNDPVLTDLLVRQRRTPDPAARRRLLHDIQRHVAVQQYIMEIYSPVVIFVWDGALKNYGPNLGYDYGSRLVAAWLDR